MLVIVLALVLVIVLAFALVIALAFLLVILRQCVQGKHNYILINGNWMSYRNSSRNTSASASRNTSASANTSASTSISTRNLPPRSLPIYFCQK